MEPLKFHFCFVFCYNSETLKRLWKVIFGQGTTILHDDAIFSASVELGVILNCLRMQSHTLKVQHSWKKL
jgi:hypothetical protein